MRLDKIYTKTGDRGKTSLVSSERVPKTALRVEVFGTVDELNSWVGMIRTAALGIDDQAIADQTQDALCRVQNDLFDLGSVVAFGSGTEQAAPEFPEERIAFLEARMDAWQSELTPLSSFVLPGGGTLNAHAHVARAVCRRAERLVWRLHEEEPLQPSIPRYLNRLSDLFFSYSRWVAKRLGEPEFLWERPEG